jgi:NAD(P)H dehydrogenase (quinone)
MHQSSIAVVYHSATGMTHQLATEIVIGANQIDNIKTIIMQIHGEDIVDGRFSQQKLQVLDSVDAIIFGSPTYMGSVSAQFKAFADASSETWERKSWNNKLASGFTIGGSMSGEQQVTLQYIQTLALQHGMLWLGMDAHRDEQHPLFGRLNRFGASSGLITQSTSDQLDPVDANSARYLGYRIATGLNRFSAYFS